MTNYDLSSTTAQQADIDVHAAPTLTPRPAKISPLGMPQPVQVTPVMFKIPQRTGPRHATR